MIAKYEQFVSSSNTGSATKVAPISYEYDAQTAPSSERLLRHSQLQLRKIDHTRYSHNGDDHLNLMTEDSLIYNTAYYVKDTNKITSTSRVPQQSTTTYEGKFVGEAEIKLDGNLL